VNLDGTEEGGGNVADGVLGEAGGAVLLQYPSPHKFLFWG